VLVAWTHRSPVPQCRWPRRCKPGGAIHSRSVPPKKARSDAATHDYTRAPCKWQISYVGQDLQGEQDSRIGSKRISVLSAISDSKTLEHGFLGFAD
jgi:hypothetical protein